MKLEKVLAGLGIAMYLAGAGAMADGVRRIKEAEKNEDVSVLGDAELGLGGLVAILGSLPYQIGTRRREEYGVEILEEDSRWV